MGEKELPFILTYLYSFLSHLFSHITGEKKMFCYYSSDAQYRLSVGRFLPENIDPTLCTHVIFAFFQPNGLDVQAVGARDLVDYSGTDLLFLLLSSIPSSVARPL